MTRVKGTVYTNTGSTLSLVDYYVEYTLNSQNIVNNTSNITIHHYAQANSTSVGTYDGSNGPSSTIRYTPDGGGAVTVLNRNQAMDFRNKKLVDLGSWTGNVTHNSNGSRTITINTSFNLNFSSAYVHHGSASVSWRLPDIARKTSAPTFSAYVEGSTTIRISPASSSFTHSLKLDFGSESHYLDTGGIMWLNEYKTSGSTFLFEPPSSYYNEFSGTSKTGTLTLKTYSGSTLIGTDTSTFTIYADSYKCKPTLSGTLIDVNTDTVQATGDKNKLVLGQSTGQVNLTNVYASSRNDSNATITRLYIDNNSVSTSTRSYNIPKISKSSVTVSLTNSRGFSNNYTITATGGTATYQVLTLTINFSRTQPTTGKISYTISGQADTTINGVANTVSLTGSYREKNASEWVDLAEIKNDNVTISNKRFSISGTLTGTYDYQKSYEFRVIAKDNVTTQTKTTTVTEGKPVLWWNKNKVVSEKDFYIGTTKVKTIYNASDVGAVPISGGTMTGRLTLSGDPTSSYHAVTKQYVDKYVLVQSGTLSLTYGFGYSYSADAPSYYKVNNIVYLRGLINRTSNANSLIATLPSGFRPAGNYNRFPLANGYYSNSFIWLQIASNGQITILNDELFEAVSLSGICFVAEN